MNAKERERLEYELYSIKSTIACMREILDECDSVVLDSFQPIVNRAIDITGEYSFQLDGWFKSYPGPNNTIFVATSEEFVEVYYRGKSIDKAELREQHYCNYFGSVFRYKEKKYVVEYNGIVECRKLMELFTSHPDSIKYKGKKIFNGKNVFCKIIEDTLIVVVDDKYNGFIINSSGTILHRYFPGKFNEWKNGYCRDIYVLSDGRSLLLQFIKEDNGHYQIIQPL